MSASGYLHGSILETVKYPVSHGTDINAKNKDGQTALDRATGCDLVSNYLRSHGARSGEKD